MEQMSHGLQGKGWEIMWDNCWIALASGNQKGLEKEVDEEGEGQRIQQALRGVGCGGHRGFSMPM